MFWDIFLIIALIIFLGLAALAIALYKKKVPNRAMKMLGVLLAATAAAAYALVLPVQLTTGCGLADGIIITFQSMLQAFSLDGDYSVLAGAVNCAVPALQAVYLIFAALLYVLAPILTAGVVLSFFHDLSARLRLSIFRQRNLYVFSELNEKSLALARSCVEHEKVEGGKALVIFTDVYTSNDEAPHELQERAEDMGALCFKKDILSLRLPKGDRKLNFFIIGEDDSENIEHALELINHHGSNPKAYLYSFTASTESALLLGSAMNGELQMTVRRINQAQSMVYNYLYENNIFSNVIDLPNGEKLLRVVIVGMGRYGTEFLKGLVWAGQVPGYQLDIHVFDADDDAEGRFSSMCPELMDLNGNQIEGEAHYQITFHHTESGKGINARTRVFDDHIAALGDVSLAIVALGNDEADVEISMKLRTLFRRHVKGVVPIIEAVVYQPTKADLVRQRTFIDYRGNDAQIHFIGELDDTYSYDVIVNSELENAAKERHLMWCDRTKAEQVHAETVKFYRFEYFYRSSVASVIRRRIRSQMGVPGIDKAPGERTREERIAIQRMEHAGWNAYMRTEGFCKGPRDDMAKLHHLLIPFDELPPSEQEKDDD